MGINILDDPAMGPMVFWYAIECFNKIRAAGTDGIMGDIDAAQQFSLEHPLFERGDDGRFPRVDLPTLGNKSGPYVAVLMASFLIYEQHLNFGGRIVIPDSKLLRWAEDAFQIWDRKGYRGPGEEVEDVSG